MTLDLKDKTIYRSPEYYAAFGATEADNTYDGLTRFVHPDDLQEIQRQFDEAVQTAKPYHAEFRVIRDDGVIRWLGNLGNTEYDEDGTPARFFNTIFDITERKQRELNQAFVGEMDRVLSGIMDTDQIIGTACEKIGKYLGVANCTLAEVDTDVNTAIVGQVWCRDEDAVDFSGFYDLAGFVSESYRQAVIAGRSVIVEDVTSNEVTAGFSDKFLALKIGSFVNTPFLSEGV
jgi:PAS domain S-box-containing protein